MPYKVKAIFAEGITEEDIAQALGIDPSTPMPPGNLSHQSVIENGRLVYIDEWESKEIFASFFSMAQDIFNQSGVPAPTIEEQ